jgi:enolase
MMNIINGGEHADNSVDFQEFMILPVGAPIREAVRYGAEVFHALKAVLGGVWRRRWATRAAFAPTCPPTRPRSRSSLEAIEKAGYKAGEDIYLGMDVAARSSTRTAVQRLKGEGAVFDAAGITDCCWTGSIKYPIISIEDGLAEGDWDGWKLHTERLGKKVQLVGDDLFVTNTKILKEGHRQGHRQLDPDQGQPDRSLTETLEAIQMAHDAGYRRGGLASLRRDRGHDHRRSGVARPPVRSRPVRCRARPRGQVQPADAYRGSIG